MSLALTIRTKLTIHYYTIIQYIYMFFYISSEDNYIRKLVIVIVLSHAHDQQNKLTKMKSKAKKNYLLLVSALSSH